MTTPTKETMAAYLPSRSVEFEFCNEVAAMTFYDAFRAYFNVKLEWKRGQRVVRLPNPSPLMEARWAIAADFFQAAAENASEIAKGDK